MAFSNYIKELRVLKNISSAELAQILGISVTAVKLIENETTKFPSERVLNALSSYLEKTPLDVMEEILFKDERFEKNIITSYLAYQYLMGWNIADAPYKYSAWEGYQLCFSGRIIKKREPQNIVIVSEYTQNLGNLKKVETKEDAVAYIGKLVGKLLLVDEYRGVHLLFDKRHQEECDAYEVMRTLRLNRIGFMLELILYDCEDGNIIKRVIK